MGIDQSLHEMPDQSRKAMGVIFFQRTQASQKSRVILQSQQRPMVAAVQKTDKNSC